MCLASGDAVAPGQAALVHAASVQTRQPADAAFAEALPVDRGAAGLGQTLRKLHTRASLIMINAHPDDEDGGMLAYESRKAGADVSLLSLTRGEGGQNVMTGDFWDALGILRTQELLAASRYNGAHLYFTRVADFGFSKTLDEALKQWGHDRLLGDVVRVVRMTRPMVITSVFSGNISDGHGHHQASGVMAQEAFNAAGDPAMFPEQIREGLRPWKPLKVYARVPFARVTDRGIYDYATGHWEPVRFKNYVTGQYIEGAPAMTLSVPEGLYDPLLARSYFQIAREGLNEQKSQNGGIPIPLPGQFDSPYHLYASRVGASSLPQHEENFFDGIDTSLEGMIAYLPVELPEAQRSALRVKLAAIAEQVDAAQRLLKAEDTNACAAPLARGLQLSENLLHEVSAGTLPDDTKENISHELRLKQQQFSDALAQSLGMDLLATVQAPGAATGRNGPFGPLDAVAASAAAGVSLMAIPDEPLLVDVHVANQGSVPVTIEHVTLRPQTGASWQVKEQQAIDGTLAGGTAKDALFSATVPPDAAVTRPYFSRSTIEQSSYGISNMGDLGRPEMPYPLEAAASYTYNGVHAELRGVVQTAHRALGRGVVLQPLILAPAISIRVTPVSGILPLSATQLPLDVTIHSGVKGPAEGTVELKLLPGWTASPPSARFAILHDNEDVGLHFQIEAHGLKAKPYTLTVLATFAGKTYAEGFTSIGYPGVLPYPQFAPAQSRVRGIDLKTAPELRVAYIMGTGDDVPQALSSMGVHVTLLSGADIEHADLRAYDAIVLGIRTYAARPELRAFNGRLLQYVKDGGVVISEYQTAEYDHDYGPYPISVPGDAEKVVEEDAAVTILKPNDPALQWPNRIGPADFQNWVEERGHGFPRSFDSHFTALTEVHDAGQDSQTGGLVYARYGKGYYVYLAYAFFRQMPEGVPGPFRIMSNLLSLGKNPGLPH